MAFRYIGKWGGSPDGDSPTLWQDDVTGDYLMQGYTVDEALVRELLATAGKDTLPDGELIIRWPADMIRLFQKGEDTGVADAG